MRIYKDIYLNEKVVWLVILISITLNIYLFSEVRSYQVLVNNLKTIVLELEENMVGMENDNEKPSLIYVQVEGEVAKPGVYSFSGDVRVLDLLNKAGGFTESAKRAVVNQVRLLHDGEVIYIPSVDEEYDIYDSKSNLININRATINELMILDGIGEAKAKEIIKYRDANGVFRAKEDILKVSGIGPAIYDRIESSITVH